MADILNLDKFERELLALITDLRVDESIHQGDEARQKAYISTGRKHGFL